MVKMPLNGARSLVDSQTFRDEPQNLAHVWTFLGLTQDVARDGDWFRASIATRSVFVQRFGEELRGFENVCVHRSYPLRNEDKGNGPVICGFHGWQYNRDGLAVGIPMCTELFGKPPHAVAARLKQIELAICGALIFGRFPAPDATTTLQEFLGNAGPILEAMTRFPNAPYHLRKTIRANWKLNMQVSLDDYHSPTIHRTTFGRGGHLRADRVRWGAVVTVPIYRSITLFCRYCRI
jgi:phenylpropionate dioxygenase-like ring-hydroxylating dioxygenase large terminal subunit